VLAGRTVGTSRRIPIQTRIHSIDIPWLSQVRDHRRGLPIAVCQSMGVEMQVRALTLSLVLIAGSGLYGCEQKVVPSAAPAPKLTATIQDLMAFEVDPSADDLWEAVATIVAPEGTTERQPHTDAEWREVRRYAITLSEAGNLLIMPGRRVAAPGKKLEDEGIEGILTAAQVQAAIDTNPAVFRQFAESLQAVGEQMLTAIDARDAQGLVDAGESLDSVCEGCHMTFWYPGQKIPRFPDEAPE
jgi:hypothetical protein